MRYGARWYLLNAPTASRDVRYVVRKEPPAMIVYCILEPSQEKPLGYIRCAAPPSPEQMADHLAIVGGFENRDHFLHLNPGISLGFAPLH